MSMWARR